MNDKVGVRLDHLPAHQFAVIQHIEAADDDSERLMSLGVCAGRTVELIKAGDPLILKVFASRIGLSARLAKRVFVEPLANQSPPR
ncbi:MAG: FeoA family protein [Verrucomicrobia bacterium]|nr:FeoA family protein [Verrucomicrobiota bacterium]